MNFLSQVDPWELTQAPVYLQQSNMPVSWWQRPQAPDLLI